MIRRIKINAWRQDADFRKSFYIFSLSKIIILVIGILATLLIPAAVTHRQIVTENWFLNAWAQYDARAYLDIAQNGYNAQFPGGGNYAWYPLYPLLIKIFSFIGYDLSAFLISNIASFIAIFYLFRLVKEEFGNKIAKKTILYLSFFPTVYFLTAMYAESMLLMLTVMSFYYAKKDKWIHACVLGLFASMTRIQGALLFFPIAYMYCRSRNFNLMSIGKRSLSLLLIPLGALIVMLYHYAVTGNAFIQFSTQAAYGRVLAAPWKSFETAILNIISPTSTEYLLYNAFNLVMALGFIFLAVYSFRLLKKEYGIYFLISMLVPISSMTLLSISRHDLVMFPAFIVMAKMAEKKKYGIALGVIYVVFFALLLFFTARHVNEWFLFSVV